MSPALKQLLLGALKSGVASLCSTILALPITDPTTFNLASLGGWKHILTVTGVIFVVAEARYWIAWAGSNSKP